VKAFFKGLSELQSGKMGQPKKHQAQLDLSCIMQGILSPKCSSD
jgi:hypothetical protein